MKRVYLIRHGKAEDYDPGRHQSDADRALTPEGREALAQIGRELRRLDSKIAAFLTSPARRAKETAEILAKFFDATVESSNEMVPPMSAPRLLSRVRARKEERIALVGHEPGLGLTAARWLDSSRHVFPFKKGGIARFDVPDHESEGSVELAWLATPELFGAK